MTAKQIEQVWNACIDFHDNQGENDVKYPDLDELKERMLNKESSYEFRKVRHFLSDKRESFPMTDTVSYNTIGLYKNNADGTQTFIDELTREEMKALRSQDNLDEVLNKLK